MGILWGLTFSLAKMSTEGGAHPIGINFWCCLIGAAVLISGSFILRRPLPLRRDVLIVCTVCGVLGSVIPGTAYFTLRPASLPAFCPLQSLPSR